MSGASTISGAMDNHQWITTFSELPQFPNITEAPARASPGQVSKPAAKAARPRAANPSPARVEPSLGIPAGFARRRRELRLTIGQSARPYFAGQLASVSASRPFRIRSRRYTLRQKIWSSFKLVFLEHSPLRKSWQNCPRLNVSTKESSLSRNRAQPHSLNSPGSSGPATLRSISSDDSLPLTYELVGCGGPHPRPL